MTLKTIVPLALLFALPFISYAQKRDSTIIDKLYLLVDEEKYDSALLIVDKEIKKDPTWAHLYDIRGDVQVNLDNRKAALADYTKAIRYSNGDPIYIQHRAVLFYSMQMPEEAIRDNDMALSLVKNNDSLRQGLLVNRANAKAMKRDFDGATKDFLSAVQLDSISLGALVGLGATLDELGKEEEAIAYLERAIRHYPEDVAANGNLAYRYMGKGQYERAIELFSRILEANPEEPLCYNNRGYAKFKLGDYKGAYTDIQKSLEIYSQNSYALKNRALIYIATGFKEKACEDLDMALKYGFTERYGDEVLKLKENYCIKGKL